MGEGGIRAFETTGLKEEDNALAVFERFVQRNGEVENAATADQNQFLGADPIHASGVAFTILGVIGGDAKHLCKCSLNLSKRHYDTST